MWAWEFRIDAKLFTREIKSYRTVALLSCDTGMIRQMSEEVHTIPCEKEQNRQVGILMVTLRLPRVIAAIG